MSATKTIAPIDHERWRNTRRAPPFYPPAPVKRLHVTLAQLIASVARVSALSGAPRDVITALAESCRAQIEAFCPSSGAGLTVDDRLLNLIDAGRTAFSGMIGAGIADLYLTDLRYIYRCNAREWIRGGKVADFIYDGPPTQGTGVVLAEAKGSIASHTTAQSIRSEARRGYREQIAPHIGTEIRDALILHGYAVGFGARPGAGTSFVHVVETGRSERKARSAPSLRNIGTRPRRSGGPGGPNWGAFNRHVALENFRAIFRLMGSYAATDAIDARTRGSQLEAPGRLLDEFTLRAWRGGRYIMSRDPNVDRRIRATYFGLREEVAEVLFSELMGTKASSTDILLPYWPAAQALSALSSEGAACPDGFAYFGTYDPDPNRTDVPWRPQWLIELIEAGGEPQ